jgi:soluble cytochrome b562
MPTLRDVAAMLDTVSTSETQYHDGIGLIVVTVAEAIILKELGEIATAETTLARADDARNIHMNL